MKSLDQICRSALRRLLRPIVQYCIRRSLKQRELYEFIKAVFVEVAEEELERLGSVPTPSKICAMTGVQRRDVSRILALGPAAKPPKDLISRVIGLWQAKARYRNSKGEPKVLSFAGRDGEFAKLIDEVSTDLNPYTVAFELQRSGVAEQTQNGIKLLKRGYEPEGDVEGGLQLLAEDSINLHSAVCENIFEAENIKNLHVKTEFDNIPASYETEIRQWFLENGGNFHRSVRMYLSSLDRDINPEIKEKHAEEPALRAVIGTVSYTSRSELPPQEQPNLNSSRREQN